MVVDNAALKVFSSCCQMYELISISKVYHVEKLNKNRKKFRKTDAIYFVSPCEESIQQICDDFTDEATRKYGAVHLCFTSHVSDELMLPIAQNRLLAPRMASFCEINLDFYMFNENVYHLNMKNTMPVFKILDDEPEFLKSSIFGRIRDEITHRLLTVCTVYNEFPYIQYQGSSQICHEIAGKLQSNLSTFYKRTKRIKPREPRATFLIVDRSIDIVSPVIHDYYYQNIVYDTREVGENGKTKADNRVVYLNDQDDLWVRFRNQHLAFVMNTVNSETQQVIKDSKKGKVTNTDDMNLQEMAELLREMPKVEELMKNY